MNANKGYIYAVLFQEELFIFIFYAAVDISAVEFTMYC